MDNKDSTKLNKDSGRRARKSFRLRDISNVVYSSPWPWGVGFALALAALLTPGLSFHIERYELGQISPVTIRAPLGFSYEDKDTTETRRLEAAEQVLEIYNFNDAALPDVRNRIANAFEFGRQNIVLEKGAAIGERTSLSTEIIGNDEVAAVLTIEQLVSRLQENLGVTLTNTEVNFLLEKEFSIEIEKVLSQAVTSVLARDIVASKERLLSLGRPITRREVISRNSQVRRDFSSILSVGEARDLVGVQTAQLSDLRQAARRRLTDIGSRFIEPTLTFNLAETERLEDEARKQVDAVYFQVRRGKTIVRAGDEVDAKVLRQLQFMTQEQGRRWGLAGAFGALLLSCVLVLFQWHLLRPMRNELMWRRQSFAMVAIVIVGHLAFARVFFFVVRVFSEQLVIVPLNNSISYYYIMPFASVAVLVLLLEHAPTALLTSVVFSISIGIMTGNLQLALVSLISCVAAILGLFQYKRRTALFQVALLIGSVNVAAVAAIDLLNERYFPISTFSFDLLCAFLGGAAVSVVVSFLLPAFESLFHRTTDIKLLELSNNNVPVLRRLALEAPGTYHHSVVVGSLAEAAAEVIGANPIFCRTAALYHDIGKLQKVSYFVENQFGINKHDKLTPRMSALIIASHVKEGIEMGKEIDLPPEIIDIIPQHHGTKLITYFYEKARDEEDPSLGDVTEEEFRYPGPKPQTKEAGIIMIADAVEAASRTIEEPNPARLKGMIRQIIDYIFLDGQLNECDLTLRDLEKISQTFLRVLMGIHHHRVSYPGFDFEKKVEPVVIQDSR